MKAAEEAMHACRGRDIGGGQKLSINMADNIAKHVNDRLGVMKTAPHTEDIRGSAPRAHEKAGLEKEEICGSRATENGEAASEESYCDNEVDLKFVTPGMLGSMKCTIYESGKKHFTCLCLYVLLDCLYVCMSYWTVCMSVLLDCLSVCMYVL